MPKTEKHQTEFVNLRLPKELLDIVKKQAKENERSISGQIRWMLMKFISSQES